MNGTTLYYRLRGACTYCFYDAAQPIAGNAFDADAKRYQVIQIFGELIKPLSIGKTVKLRRLDIVILVKYQANLIRKIGSINQQVYLFQRLDVPSRIAGKLLIKISLKRAFAIPTTLGDVGYGMPILNPLLKPN